MRHLVKHFQPYFFWFVALLFLVWGQSQTNLALPGYSSKIVDDGIVQQNIAAIWSNGGKMILVTLLGGFLSIAISFLASQISTGFARRLREDVFSKVENFSLNEFNAFSSSSLVTRATNDIQQIQNISSMLMRMSLMAPFMGIGAIHKAYLLAPSMSWIVFIAVCFLAALIAVLFFLAIPQFRLIQQLVDKLGLQIREMLTGVRVIRAYNKDANQHKKFNQTNVESRNLNIYVGRMMGLMNPLMTLLMGVSSMAVVWWGAYLVEAGSLDIGNILALTQYISQAIISFLMLSMIFIMVPRAAVSAKRVEEIMAVSPEIVDPAKPLALEKKLRGKIQFQKVSFGYEGSEQPLLTDVSFVAEPGQTTAIIGGTGSGKSTLVNLIARLYDVTDGAIKLDAVDIRQITQRELHRHISYVPQKALLFSGTVKSNISYGNPAASKKEIQHAAEIAQTAEFIQHLPKGMDSDISQSGSNLSGGQKQRIAIARAIVKKAAVYLLDDSFSALDFRTDAALRKALNEELKQATVIIVGQRISTIMNADKIIVLDNGAIVGQGTHQQLLKDCSVYREIAQSQLSEEELNQTK